MSEVCYSQESMEEDYNFLRDDLESFRIRKINVFEAPEFTQRLKTFLEVETGKSATFVGYFRGTPPPVVTWCREEQILSNTDKNIIVTDQSAGCSILTITHVNRRDEGPYKCRIENREGIASSTGYLSIIAAKSRRVKKRGLSASRVSSPPVLKSIEEQAMIEAREEEEYVKMPPSPLNEFIAAIKHTTRSMNSAINYGRLQDLPEESLDEKDEITMNGTANKVKKNKKVAFSDDEMSAGETSETELTTNKPHYSSLSQMLGLDSVSHETTGLDENIKSSQQTPQKRQIRITTAARKSMEPNEQTKTNNLPIFQKPLNFSNDKLDLYMKTNNLSNIISPKITRPQQLETNNSFQQKQLQKLQQIQDFKLQKQQLRLQHKELQEKLQKQEQKFIEQKQKKSCTSEQRPLKIDSTDINLQNDVESINNSKSGARNKKLIEIRVLSPGLKDPIKPVSITSTLLISTAKQPKKPSLLEELASSWISNPQFCFQLSFIIAASLAALATDSHPFTVIIVVTIASLIAFSQLPQTIFSMVYKK